MTAWHSDIIDENEMTMRENGEIVSDVVHSVHLVESLNPLIKETLKMQSPKSIVVPIAR
jgi:hypothetical protein